MASTAAQENGRDNGRVTTEVGGDAGGDCQTFLKKIVFYAFVFF